MWTYPPRRILAAVDFGEASADALRLAGELVRAFDASLSVLHAEAADTSAFVRGDRRTDHGRRASRDEAVQFLQRFAEQHAGRPASASLSDAPPADAILRAAHDHDLIVMGTHGRKGPARWWAGSVAEAVVRKSTIPVLVVRNRPAEGAAAFTKIAVIASGGTFDGAARRYARGLAATFGGEASRESLRSLELARLENASLVVVARPARSPATGLLGAAEHAIRSCRGPVLFVPPL